MDNQDYSSCSNCNARVVSSETLTPANNYRWTGGNFKVPKVLAEFVIQLDSESKIRLNEPAYEIKRIEKQIFLTQCRYIPPTDKIFLAGYIRANIEYAVKNCVTDSGIGGSIKDITVHIPIKAYTQVNFNSLPQVIPNVPPAVARYFDAKRMGKNFREADRLNVEVFNEPVYCELEWSGIVNAGIDDKGVPIDGFINEEEFQEFTDKSVVYLCMKLLQKQQVSSIDSNGGSKSSYNGNSQGYSKGNSNKCSSVINSGWNFPITDLTRNNQCNKK